MEDDVLEETKARRLQEIVDLQQKHAWFRSEEFVGQTVEVLVEKISKSQPKNFQDVIHKVLPWCFRKNIIK